MTSDTALEPLIRQAMTPDLLRVEAVVRDAYTPYVARIGREPGPMGDDYDSLIRAGRVHVVEASGRIQGVLVLLPQDDALLLDNVAVDPAARGKGLGRALLAFAERAATDAGFDRIRLYTNEVMTENFALYRRLGYVEIYRAEEKGLRRIYMTKSLSER